MRVLFFCIVLFVCFASTLLALDEDSYVRLTAQTVIAAHKFRGNAEGMGQWLTKMRQQYPEFMGEGWQSFEREIARDGSNKGRVYNRILEEVKSKGYNARISNLGEGSTAIEILD